MVHGGSPQAGKHGVQHSAEMQVSLNPGRDLGSCGLGGLARTVDEAVYDKCQNGQEEVDEHDVHIFKSLNTMLRRAAAGVKSQMLYHHGES